MWSIKTTMKHAILGAILTLGFFSAAAESSALTFDDLTTPAPQENPFGYVPNGYGGLNWSNMFYEPGATPVPSGYRNAVVSGENIAYNGFGEMAAISGGYFNFTGAYFTAAWRDGLNIELKGFSGSELLYYTTFAVNTAGPTWYQADFSGIDKLEFNSFGGIHNVAYTGYGFGTNFAMDDFTYNVSAVPIPAAVWLFGSGLGLLGWIRRRNSSQLAQ